MRLSKKQWLLMQTVALLFVMGGAILVRPHLARAISVAPTVIMEKLGGSIEATSAPGKGTAITLTWPS